MTDKLRPYPTTCWATGYSIGNGLRFSVLMPPDLARAVTAAAKADGITLSEKVRRVLAEAIQKDAA